MAKPGGILRKSLEDVPYDVPPYSTKYPGMATILDDQPGAPLHNRFMDNLGQTDPVVAYDFPKTIPLGIDEGNRTIVADKIDFPASLDGIPRDTPAQENLKETQILILKTIETMKALSFFKKAAH